MLTSSQVTANWIEAMSRADAAPCFLVQIDVDGSTSFEFISSAHTALGYLPTVLDVTPVSGSIDPIERTYSAGRVQVTIADEEAGGVDDLNGIRQIIKNNRVYGKRIIVKLGEESLAEADYAPYFRGRIADYKTVPGAVVIETQDAYRILEEVTLPTPINHIEWLNSHPLEIIDSILTDANVPSDLIDATSLDPDTYTASISHWNVVRGPTGRADSSLYGESTARKLIDELCELLGGGFAPTEEGKLTFSRFDAGASADDDWTASDILNFDQDETTTNIINRVTIEFLHDSKDDKYGFRMTHGDTDSQGNYAYPGESEAVFAKPLKTKWLNAYSYSQGSLATSGTSISVWGGNADSFCGMRDDGSSGWTVSASRLMYLLLVTENNQAEVIEVDTATLDPDFEAWNPDGGGTTTVAADFDLTTNGRKITETAGTTGYAFPAQTLVFDVTIHMSWLRRVIERLGDGLPIVRVRTTLNKYKMQLGDMVTLDLSDLDQKTFLAYNKSGLTGTDKWEVVSKEVDAAGDSPGITWILAKGTSNTGYTEEWSPGHAEDTGTDPVVDIDVTPYPDLHTRIFDMPWIEWGIDVTIATGTNVDFRHGLIGGPGPYVPPRVVGGSSIPVTASKDTYASYDVGSSRVLMSKVATDAAPPATAAMQIPLAKIATGASSVTSVGDMRPMAAVRVTPTNASTPAKLGGFNFDFAEGANFERLTPTGWRVTEEDCDWDTDITVSTSTVLSGVQSLHFRNTTPTADPEMGSDLFQVDTDEYYQVSVSVQADSITAGNTFAFKFVTYEDDRVTEVSQDTVFNTILDAANTWELKTSVIKADNAGGGGTDPKWARILLGKNNTAFNVYVDSVSVQVWKPVASVELSANSTGLNKSQTIALNQVRIDPTNSADWVNTGSNRIDIQKPGRYLVLGQIQFSLINAENDGRRVAVKVRVNNTTNHFLHQIGGDWTTWGVGDYIFGGTKIIEFVQGDYIQLTNTITDDTSYTVGASETFLDVVYLGPISGDLE